MSDPTLTDEQREAEGALCGCGHRVMWHHDKRGCQYHGNGLDRCPCSLTSEAVVAAMLADERAAREAAEAKVRDLTAGIGALCEEARKNGWPVPPSDLRALVDDPAAALAEVRAEAWDEGKRDAWKGRDTDEGGFRFAPNPYRAEAEGAGR